MISFLWELLLFATIDNHYIIYINFYKDEFIMSYKTDKKMINPLTGGLYFSKHNRTNPIENTTNELNPYYKPIPSKLSI